MLNIPSELTPEVVRLILVPQEDIRQLAYFLWEQDGRPESDGNHYWFAAETRLQNKLAGERFIAANPKVEELLTDAAKIAEVLRSEPDGEPIPGEPAYRDHSADLYPCVPTNPEEAEPTYDQQLRNAEPEYFPALDAIGALDKNQVADIKRSIAVAFEFAEIPNEPVNA